MKIKNTKAKSIIVRSNIPEIDFVINPYTGCQHGCIYCYAEFMKRFTNHKGEQWGEFLDIKEYDFTKIKPHKYDGKTILLSSVTDPYVPIEMVCKNTRKILKNLLGTKAEILILTKSKHVLRDIDLFKQFENIEVGISICCLDETFSKKVEPIASKPIERLDAIKELHENGIRTYVFISPFFPKITPFKEIIEKSESYTNYYMFENLNYRPHNISRILNLIEHFSPDLLPLYREMKDSKAIWNLIEEDIKKYCHQKELDCKIEFHHGGFS